MESTACQFYKYEIITRSYIRTSLQRGFCVKSQNLIQKRFMSDFPLLLWAGPGSASLTNSSIPHSSMSWFTLKIQDGIEIMGLGCRWGLFWFLALLQTRSAGHVSSLPISSKYWELINCMATAQVIFIIIVCLTIFKVPITKWLLFILALKQW